MVVAVPAVSHAAGGGGGLEIFPDKRIVVQLLLFTALIIPIHRFLFAPIMRVLEERKQQIDGARESAEAMQGEADAVYGKYRETLRSERERVETERRDRIDNARDERVKASEAARAQAEDRISAARSEIAITLEEARGQLRAEADVLAREAASRILGRELQ